ncbi:hypothetical protein FNV43_RR20635 [Rhamnella rubrinervis]|uniref:Xylanase inhibitor N-terminal domain-containing protein n=1 Tax=Rhamnella rubrinervis TaxID=2594499 RepID=A0A8K0E137_9ROSA|nr:hypothetical protein FNV43_RR20635 [Rhamnella rubrinervis]
MAQKPFTLYAISSVFFCQPCFDCYKQTDPVFDPTSSSSYNLVTCDYQLCKKFLGSSCSNGSCPYKVSYGDGSYTNGDFVTETVSFGNSGSLTNFVLGRGHMNRDTFAGFAGWLALVGADSATTVNKRCVYIRHVLPSLLEDHRAGTDGVVSFLQREVFEAAPDQHSDAHGLHWEILLRFRCNDVVLVDQRKCATTKDTVRFDLVNSVIGALFRTQKVLSVHAHDAHREFLTGMAGPLGLDTSTVCVAAALRRNNIRQGQGRP